MALQAQQMPASSTALAVEAGSTASVSSSSGQAMSPVSIQDLEAGKIDIDAVLEQIEFLHGRLERIRYDMHMFINALASIEETSVPQEVYKEMSARVVSLKTEFVTFFNAYKCVLPVIRYFKIKQGMSPDDSIKITPHRVQVDPKLLNELKLPASDVEMVVSSAVSAVSTPVTASAVAGPGSSAANTPSGKKPVAKPYKRKNVKKAP